MMVMMIHYIGRMMLNDVGGYFTLGECVLVPYQQEMFVY
jgi:hypothetical protein